jgi:hypothetical protein
VAAKIEKIWDLRCTSANTEWLPARHATC